MMLLPVERLIDGMIRTLIDAVLPAVGTRFARGQLYAVIDVLQNLRDRVEQKAALYEDAALRAAVVAGLERVDALPAAAAEPARAALGEHLAAQAMGVLAILKPSLLAEISKG